MEHYPAFLEKHPKTTSFNLNDARFSLRDHLAYYHDDEFPLLMHAHDFYELNIIVKGRGRHYIEDKNFPFSPGAVFVIPPRIEHGYWAEDNDASIFHLLIDQRMLQKYSLELNSFSGYYLLFETEPELRKSIASTAFFLQLGPLQLREKTLLMDKLTRLAKTTEHPILFETYAMALIYDLSALIEKAYSAPDRPDTQKNYLYIVNSVNYIIQHLSKPFRLDDLAHLAMESRTSYIEKFKHLFKLTPFEYIRKLRVNHAIELLVATSQPVSLIAQSCGFSDSAHFIKIFKEDTGETPARFRHTHRMQDGAPFPPQRLGTNSEKQGAHYATSRTQTGTGH